jgi:Ala-tRNA(Pro) deacylase
MDQYRGQAEVYKILNRLSIPFEYYEHEEAPTIEIARQFYRGEGTTLCKNLFFRNHKGNRHYLVILECDRILDIHDLEKRLHQGKLSFASEERMIKHLGLRPGSVSPFGLINDKDHQVHVFIDDKLQYVNKLSFHPNLNTASLVITTYDFIRYMNWTGNAYEFIRLYED